ncbi:hypothetical protein BAUCODRAFT_64579 [Baudoinia panamericana UAMH 10762]|uniref:Methyltransferase domain-containing protein n=1 Tax=Baudoinia panamericana (strain UAMH 10762) TaxID=717646 RepID=M2NI69_BAUPA|nr:uncharacterized protein BAUCODRAFT_64579 [Baudoinia panamericana UAMH 10762]EMC99049.1 hypothetical protein BAUCODRAFT_64579 [Baudoinia panamericana UAMH 10762]
MASGELIIDQDFKISEDSRDTLLKYTKIPPDELETHVRTIRDKAFAVHPYPCIGLWRFLDFGIAKHKLYKPEILPRMLTGEQTYLDLGCAFAQDIRKLVSDGVDSKHCYGSDLRLDFLELGYDLFRDRQTLKSTFIAADIFASESQLFKELSGKVDIIDASSFFHLFARDEQKAVARQVVRLMKPQKDALLVGRQIGSTNPGEVARRSGNGTRFRHNIDSWRQMWDEVGEEVGLRFEVDGRTWGREVLTQVSAVYFTDETLTFMEFSVRRV